MCSKQFSDLSRAQTSKQLPDEHAGRRFVTVQEKTTKGKTAMLDLKNVRSSTLNPKHTFYVHFYILRVTCIFRAPPKETCALPVILPANPTLM